MTRAPSSSAHLYRSPAAIAWVRDARQTLLVDRDSGRSWALTGVERIAWDLLVLGYPFEGVVDLLAVLLGEPAGAARTSLLAILSGWLKAGILEPDGERGRG